MNFSILPVYRLACTRIDLCIIVFMKCCSVDKHFLLHAIPVYSGCLDSKTLEWKENLYQDKIVSFREDQEGCCQHGS